MRRLRIGFFWFVVHGALAQTNRVPMSIQNVNIVDVVAGQVRDGMSVDIRDGRIVAIRHAAARSGPAGARVVDASGQYLIPGLWDMHAHVRDPERDFPMLVANGVLTVREMGAPYPAVMTWREDVRSGRRWGPRMVVCGPIVDGPMPTNPPISKAVATAEDGRRVVAELAAAGVDFIKVHDGVPAEAYHAILVEASRRKLMVMGHIPVKVKTRAAAEAGQRSVEHQIGLRGASAVEDEVMALEARNDVFGEAMRTKNFGLIPESIAAKGNRLLDGITVERTPTFVTMRALTFVDDLARQADERLRYITAEQQERWKPENAMLTRYRTPAYIAYRKREYAASMKLIPVARRLGVEFLAGTDAGIPYVYQGFSLHDELALLVEAGLSPLDALRAATLNPAKLFGWESSMGSVRKGRAADLVLLEANPLEEIGNTRRISGVVLQGEWFDKERLRGLLDEVAQRAALPR
jgi:imidazolonepropionase-like amidohydrolase